MDLNQRINALDQLAKAMDSFVQGNLKNDVWNELLENAVCNAEINNRWFTRKNILHAITNLAGMMQAGLLRQWVDNYPGLQQQNGKPKTVAVIMAGNIPLAGFHDFLCVLVSGHNFSGKLSSQDKFLLPACASILTAIEPGFASRISFAEGHLSSFDAVIATGSNNSARYFEQYFGGFPHIIRQHRNSAAILDGSETAADLKGLADDIFMYFGLGCRSVSFLMVPKGYDFQNFYTAMNAWDEVRNHNKYMNNYTYNTSLLLMDSISYLDNGFLILRLSDSPASPVSVVHYMEYQDSQSALKFIETHKNSLQCVAGKTELLPEIVPFGKTQQPSLRDYADGVDTMAFLLKLNNYSGN